MAWTCTLDPAYWNKKTSYWRSYLPKGQNVCHWGFNHARSHLLGVSLRIDVLDVLFYNIECLGKIITKVCKNCKQNHPRPVNVSENLSFGPFPFFHFMYGLFRSVTAKSGATMTPPWPGFFPDVIGPGTHLKNMKNADNYTGSTS